MPEQTTGVVYLCWLPYGIRLFKEFIDSYQLHASGYNHELIILFNGVVHKEDAEAYHTYIQDKKVPYQSYYYAKGQDLEAYHWIAGQLSVEYILFLNSFSRILADDWLLKYVRVSASDNTIGLIGATGSWQSYYSGVIEANTWKWDRSTSFRQHFTKYKLLLKAHLLWRWYFRPFPNPHVRTNGFFINRKLFLALRFHNPKTKFDAYCIESGRRSITRQIAEKGLKVVLIDQSGTSFQPEQWHTARLFWNAKQEHLLLSDN